MGGNTVDVLFLGDQTGLSLDFLVQALHRTKDLPLAAAFTKAAAKTLSQEIAELPNFERGSFPSFSTLSELAAVLLRDGSKHPALESALLSVSQFLHLFGHVEAGGRPYPIPRYALGLCIGSLSAAAITAAQSLSEVLPVAMEIIAIAFRVGLHAHNTSRYIITPFPDTDSWSWVFQGLELSSAQQALDEFNHTTPLPRLHKPYISAVATNTLTVSGPPYTLERLKASSNIFSSVVRVPLQVHAPYHNNFIHAQAEAEKLVLGHGSRAKAVLQHPLRKSTIFLSSNGNKLEAADFKELLTHVVDEALRATLRWDLMVNSLVTNIKDLNLTNATVLALGPSKIANNLASTLETAIDGDVTLYDSVSWNQSHTSAGKSPTSRSDTSKIAIVGLAGRFPGGANPEQFWKVLEDGLDVCKEIPSDRFDIGSHVDPNGKVRNTSHTPYGCFIDNPGHFDPLFFNMSPREAAQTCPMQRLALVTAYEALEMSGYVPNRTPSSALDRVGTFYGQTSDDYREINASQAVDTYFITGGIRAFGPGRINYHFKFEGPSFNVDTACSSSLAAIQLACTSLRSGECDTAVAGGLSILTSPDLYAGLSRGQFLSKTGSCKTFDNAADGYCRGDSVGTVVLKRLDDAIADNDNILGSILGSATNHSARAISITHPHAGIQEDLYRKVLAQSGVNPLDIEVAEMHGTGTQAGDGTEMRSISNVLAPEGARSRDNPLFVGSTKANVGHGEASSGVTALIKSLLMLQKGLIPPHVGIKGIINQGFPNLERRNIQIAKTKTPFPAKHHSRRHMLVNNFSAAGGNTALILQDYARPIRDIQDVRSSQPVVVSAKSAKSLRKNVENLVEYLHENPEISVSDLSYTTTARRYQHDLRIAVAGATLTDVESKIRARLTDLPVAVPSKPSEIAFVFTGQGSYYADLGRDLYDTSPFFRSQLLQFESIAQTSDLPSFIGFVNGNLSGAPSPTQLQLLHVSVQLALTGLWQAWGLKPTVVIGHSLGEYGALGAAGVLSPSDIIHLVGQRAQLLEANCVEGTHSMLAIKASPASIQEVCVEKGLTSLQTACLNGPTDVVLSGETADIALAEEAFNQLGYRSTRLQVPYAFHSTQVDPILDEFKILSQSIQFSSPTVPVISPFLGRVAKKEDFSAHYLVRHACDTVNFEGAVLDALQSRLIDEDTAWIEIGPHPVCLNFIKQLSAPRVAIASLRRKEASWTTLAGSAASLYAQGSDLDWTQYHNDYKSAHTLLTLPSYAFNEKNYWLEYKHNWALTKGDAGLTEEQRPLASFATTTLQRVASEKFDAEKAHVVFESDLSEPSLRAAVRGHLVNGSGLCPSSIYADMAITSASYIHQHLWPELEVPGLNIRSMEVTKPVIVTEKDEQQLLHITATADHSGKTVKIEYSSVDNQRQSSVPNAQCLVEYGSTEEWLTQWARLGYLAESRIKSLEQEALTGNVQRILRGMAYKLFSALVDYSEAYRGMDEVLLESSQREAAAKIQFKADDKQGNFHFSPYWIDSLAHLSGFVLNANDTLDSKSKVFISHGWESMRFAGQFSPQKAYRTYVKMQPIGATTVMAGDVYVFDGSDVVGLIEGLKFQQVPRAVLDHLLPNGKGSQTSKPALPSTLIANTGPVKRRGSGQVSPRQVDVVKPTVVLPQPVSYTEHVRKIIAAEIGIPVEVLQSQSSFSRLGVDSLLSLTIIGRLREELNLPVAPTAFLDHDTFGAFIADLQARIPEASENIVKVAVDVLNAGSDPYTVTSSNSDASSDTDLTIPPDGEDTADTVRSIIASEMGLDLDSIPSNTPLGSLGMDSLMSLTIAGAVKERLGLDISQSLLADDPSIDELQRRLSPRQSPTPVPRSMRKQAKHRKSSLQDENRHESVAAYYPPASSVLLQGNPKKCQRTLFLAPDGSGLATSYAALPELSPDLAVYGLNSPFLRNPRDYTCGINGIAEIFVAEIQRRQPHGPYILGGWSVGGVIAFEAASILINNGETVDQMVLIDAPCPVLLPPLPTSLVRFFDSIGLFGDSKAPTWLLEHFDATVANLYRYKPMALPASKAPETVTIWGREGVCGDPSAPRPGLDEAESKSKTWILDNRTDFGPNGWDELIASGKVTGVGVSGNHFTMLKEPNITSLASQMKYALN